MSNNIPVNLFSLKYEFIDGRTDERKQLRGAAPHGRIAVHKDENGPSRRAPLRTKPPSAVQATSSNVPTARPAAGVKAAMRPATKTTEADDLKRKRSAFGEVVVNKPKAGSSTLNGGKAGVKGKAAAGANEEVVMKSRTTTTRTTTTTTTTARRVPPPATRRAGPEPRRVTSPRRAQALRAAREDDVDEAAAEPQPKKRRTSSVEPGLRTIQS